jgi:peptidoglycan/LPS O-acetylase OafA/YrhL
VTRPGYLPALDGLRAIAIIAVFFHHALYGYLFQGGFLGVDLFFVLSGYLITGLLTREMARSGTIHFRLFYLRRACRLLPALVAAILLATAIPAGWSEWTMPWLQSVAAILFFYANFSYYPLGPLNVTWSLSLEEQFYLLWPVTFYFLLKKRSLRFVFGFIIVLTLGCAVLRSVLYHFTHLDIYALLVTRMDALLAGAGAALLAGRSGTVAVASALTRWRVPEVIIAAFIAFCYLGQKTGYLYDGGFTLVAVLGAVLITCLAEAPAPSGFRRLLESAPLVWIGRRSYGIYLYHIPLLASLEWLRVRHGYLNLACVTVLRIVLVLLVAGLSYRFLESPFLRRKAAFAWERSIPEGRPA